MRREEGREGGKERGQSMRTARKAAGKPGKRRQSGGPQRRAGQTRLAEGEPCGPSRVKGRWPPLPSVTPCESDRLIKGGG